MISDVKDNVETCFSEKQTNSPVVPEFPDSGVVYVSTKDFSNLGETGLHSNIAGLPDQPGYIPVTKWSTRVHAGFSLLEVMISVVLLSASMLGLAALQTVSTKIDHQAFLRTRSVIQAEDMVDRMRANLKGVRNNDYLLSPIPDSYSMDCSAESITCSASELAAYDLVEWNTRNHELLPSGAGLIMGYTSTSTYLVTVSWIEQSDGESAGEEFVNPCDDGKNEALHCFKIEVRL